MERRAQWVGEASEGILLVERPDGTTELVAAIAGVVGWRSSALRCCDVAAREGLLGRLAVDPLTDVLVYREDLHSRETTGIGPAVAHFRGQLASVHRLCGLSAMESDRHQDPVHGLVALHDLFAHCAPAQLSVRGTEAGSQATRLLNGVCCLLFEVLALRMPCHPEEAVLARLRDDVDVVLPRTPAGLVIRNTLAILLETVRTRDCLPEPCRLVNHDELACYLFMDASDWSSELGRYHFENELGYMAGCFQALRRLMSLGRAPLTADTLLEIHDVAIGNAFRRVPTPMQERFQKGYRSRAVSFPLIEGRNHTAAGLEEFLASPDAGTGWITIGEREEGGGLQLTANAKHSLDCGCKAADILAHYYRQLDRIDAGAPDAEEMRVAATVRCCQSLDRNHLFVDANIRTIGYLCLNKFLWDLGMEPAVLEYPKVLDMCSVAQVVEAVRRGQQRFRQLQGTGRRP
ncbi:hypothetical protein Acav_2129 [Paracidovorax avenae ATCC 19860]|uniref:Uncharacterized protein n=2 Tax=Paracidovorax avenae TaxID=80867 RepID=F0QAK0_PARA1|nr:hypothetical protein [Paracidovorax avenae]ADX46041.1 hypothetical protein Acav_2129 [Paracidovorax avenae ATCC 19860]AVS67714.1 hypothetical protein C8245_20375 [Paracidovorax avenae]